MILEGARFWPLCVAAALLTECGGGQVPLVAGAPSGGAPAADHPATSSGDNLLYVATSRGVLVRYFSTGKPILTLKPQKPWSRRWGPDYAYDTVGYWKYPAGGKPYHVVTHLTSGTMDQILDAIIVSPPSR